MSKLDEFNESITSLQQEIENYYCPVNFRFVCKKMAGSFVRASRSL